MDVALGSILASLVITVVANVPNLCSYNHRNQTNSLNFFPGGFDIYLAFVRNSVFCPKAVISVKYHLLNLITLYFCVCRGHSPDWYNSVYGYICANYARRIRDSFKNSIDLAAGPETKV